MKNIYFVASEDGAHCDVFERDLSVFEALCAYHESIIEGDLGYLEGIEFGEWDPEIDEMYTLEYHEF